MLKITRNVASHLNQPFAELGVAPSRCGHAPDLLMHHRKQPLSLFDRLPSGSKPWRRMLATFALLISAPVIADQLVRAPGWLAVMPDDAAPVVPEIRAKGSEWFVDASRGDDFAAGTRQKPWKTLGKLKRAGLSSGDVVRLKCGGVWREALDMDSRAFPVGLTIAPEQGCGAGQAPSIRGSDLMTANWAADEAQAGAFVVDRFGLAAGLFYKGQRQVPARFPDYVAPGREFALADGVKSQRSFRLRELERRLVGDRDLIGATVYVRVLPWQVEKATVRSYDPSAGAVTLDKDLSTAILNGAGYVFEGKKWMLNAAGEWWHDTQAKRLYLITPDGQRPKSTDVEVVVRDHAVRINNASQLRVMGLDLRHTSQTALDVHDVNDVAFDGLSIADPGEYGVVIYRSGRVAFRGSHVERSGWHGILTRDAPDAIVTGNVIVDHGLIGRSGGSAGAIAVKGERTVVSDNLVQRSANTGIHFFNLEGTQVLRNKVIQPCIKFTDCGGIQTWTGDSPSQATKRLVIRSVVKDNVVLGGGSNLEGSAGQGANQSNGIYFDSMTGGVQATGNVIAGTENGFYLHNAQFNTISDNAIRSVTHASVAAYMSIPGADVLRGNRIRGNQLFSRPPVAGGDEVFAFKWQKLSGPDDLFSGVDANDVRENRVLRAGGAGQTRWSLGDGLRSRVVAEGDWRKFAPNEREQVVGMPSDPPKRIGQEGANLLPDGDFKSAKSNWQAYFNPAGRGGSMVPVACGDVPCVKLTTGHMADSLSSKPFRLDSTPGRNEYVLRFTIKAGPRGGEVRASVRRDGPPYDHFGLNQESMTLNPGQVLNAVLPFKATSSDSARLFLHVEPGMEGYVSRASITRAAASDAVPVTAARSLLVINLSSKAQFVSCADTRLIDCSALDDQAKELKWPLNLRAGQAVVLFPQKTMAD